MWATAPIQLLQDLKNKTKTAPEHNGFQLLPPLFIGYHLTEQQKPDCLLIFWKMWPIKNVPGCKLLVSLLRKAELSSSIDLSQNYRSQCLNEWWSCRTVVLTWQKAVLKNRKKKTKKTKQPLTLNATVTQQNQSAPTNIDELISRVIVSKVSSGENLLVNNSSYCLFILVHVEKSDFCFWQLG